jgi:hypothetical protein
MASPHFDRFVQSLATSSPRRGVFRLLPALLALLTPRCGDESEAARRHRRTRRRDARHGQIEDERKKHRKKKRKRTNQPPVSAGPPSPPPPCAQSCAGCCAGESCRAGTSSDACGRNGASCVTCVNPTPACAGQICTACTTSTQCPPGALCHDGLCRACDVCPSGCYYASVLEAVADPAGPATVHICAGTYSAHLTIRRDVTLIGAGDGAGAGDAILDGAGSAGVVTIFPGLRVTLQRLRITGATPNNDGGSITNTSSQLTLRDCTITGNSAANGGGILNKLGGWVTLDHSHVTLNDAVFGGGVYNNASATIVLLNGSRITGNTATYPGIGGGGILNYGTVDASGGTITGNTPDQCVNAGLYGTGCP